jgi:multiple sugar transport system permease protein
MSAAHEVTESGLRRASGSTNSPDLTVGRRRRSPHSRREARLFYLFVSPWMIGFVLFGGGPIIASGVISFTDWSLLSSPHWVGLRNYRQMFSDPVFFEALRNTLYFGFGAVVLGVAFTFVLALLLNQNVRGIGIFRTVFYLPSVVAGIATALLWLQLLHPDYGLINRVLGVVGIHGPGWLSSESWAIPSLIMMSVWGSGNTIIIYLAGLQGIPTSMYEVCTLDGAGWWERFWHVTVPMMSPVIFFNLITGFIASLQTYVLVLVMTNGGPGDSTLLFGLYIYRQAFQYFDLGYASALAWVLFLVIIVITAVQFVIGRRWVYYESE